jgi:hypothetical protein
MGWASGCILYDTRHNNIVRIDGKKKFTGYHPICSNGDWSKIIYIELTRDKKALYDCRTGRAISVNGSEVFYDIEVGERRDIKYNNLLPKNTILRLTTEKYNTWGADSVNKVFFYDVERNTILAPPTEEKLQTTSQSTADFEYITIFDGNPQIINDKAYISYELSQGDKRWYVLYDPNKDSFFEIDGQVAFLSIHGERSVVIYKTLDGDYRVVDMNRGHIEEPLLKLVKQHASGSNRFVITTYPEYNDSCLKFWLYGSAFKRDVYCLYNIKLGRFIEIGGTIGFYKITNSSSGNQEKYTICPTKPKDDEDAIVFVYTVATGEIKRKRITQQRLAWF